MAPVRARRRGTQGVRGVLRSALGVRAPGPLRGVRGDRYERASRRDARPAGAGRDRGRGDARQAEGGHPQGARCRRRPVGPSAHLPAPTGRSSRSGAGRCDPRRRGDAVLRRAHRAGRGIGRYPGMGRRRSRATAADAGDAGADGGDAGAVAAAGAPTGRGHGGAGRSGARDPGAPTPAAPRSRSSRVAAGRGAGVAAAAQWLPPARVLSTGDGLAAARRGRARSRAGGRGTSSRTRRRPSVDRGVAVRVRARRRSTGAVRGGEFPVRAARSRAGRRLPPSAPRPGPSR